MSTPNTCSSQQCVVDGETASCQARLDWMYNHMRSGGVSGNEACQNAADRVKSDCKMPGSNCYDCAVEYQQGCPCKTSCDLFDGQGEHSCLDRIKWERNQLLQAGKTQKEACLGANIKVSQDCGQKCAICITEHRSALCADV